MKPGLKQAEGVPPNPPAKAKYKRMIEAWRGLPLGLANWLGPHIVRSLG